MERLSRVLLLAAILCCFWPQAVGAATTDQSQLKLYIYAPECTLDIISSGSGSGPDGRLSPEECIQLLYPPEAEIQPPAIEKLLGLPESTTQPLTRGGSAGASPAPMFHLPVLTYPAVSLPSPHLPETRPLWLWRVIAIATVCALILLLLPWPKPKKQRRRFDK